MTPTHSEAAPAALRRSVWAVVGLFTALQLAQLGRYRTLGGDETFYMEAAWTMLRSGDWMVPRYVTGELRLEKPIATYWAVAACTWVFGFSLWATRLHSVLSSLLTLPYVFGLARVTTRERATPWLAVLAYATLKSVYSNAHQGRTDAILSLFAAASVYHFARALLGDERRRPDVVLGHAFGAGAILVKGLAGVLFTYVPVAAFALLARKRLRPGRALGLLSPWGLATLALVAAPWFVYVLTVHGDEFRRIFYQDQVSANVRFDRPLLGISALSYAFYFVRETFPWWPVLLLGIVLERGAWRRAREELGGATWLLALWILLPMVLLSVGFAPRGRYLLPSFPAVAVLVAAQLVAAEPAGWTRRLLRWTIHAVALSCCALALLMLAMQLGPLWPHDQPWLLAPVLALAAAGVAASLVARRMDVWRACAAAGGLTIALLACSSAVVQTPAPVVPTVELGREVLAREPEGARLAVIGGNAKVLATALLFATGRRPTDLCAGSRQQPIEEFLDDYLSGTGPRRILVDGPAYDALPEELRARARVVAERVGLLEIGLRPDAPAWVARLPGALPAEVDRMRLLEVDAGSR